MILTKYLSLSEMTISLWALVTEEDEEEEEEDEMVTTFPLLLPTARTGRQRTVGYMNSMEVMPSGELMAETVRVQTP